MQAYKFDIKISEGGTILLPHTMSDLSGKEVEIFIVPKEGKPKMKKKQMLKNL